MRLRRRGRDSGCNGLREGLEAVDDDWGDGLRAE